MISIKDASHRQALQLLELAKRDQVAAQAFKSIPEVDFSIIAFHVQQSIEKCMKAVMAEHLLVYPRSHDLGILHGLLLNAKIVMPVNYQLLKDITPYAVTTRYEIEKENLVTWDQIDRAMTDTFLWADSLIKSAD